MKQINERVTKESMSQDTAVGRKADRRLRAAESDRLLRAAEVATIIGMSTRSAWRLISTGQIPSIRLAGTTAVRVKQSELERYIARSEAAARGPITT